MLFGDFDKEIENRSIALSEYKKFPVEIPRE
jgi:hypothetical protein